MLASNDPVAVIGAGPIGLAAAAHLRRHELTPMLIEAGPSVGHNIRQWGHVGLFSPWSMNIDDEAARLLDDAGWPRPAESRCPTGAELVHEYLQPLARLPAIAEHLYLNTRVVAVTRAGHDLMKSAGRERAPFILRVADNDGVRELQAAAVIDATGTLQTPAGLGCHGLDALGENAAEDRIDYGLPDVLGSGRGDYAGQRVLVVGGGHSAFTALRDLVALAESAPETRVIWALRGSSLDGLLDGTDDDPLPERARLVQTIAEHVERGAIEVHCGLRITDVERGGDAVRVSGRDSVGPWVDRIVAATGFRPDTTLLAETRVALDPATQAPVALAPLVDPNVHTCGSVSDHGEPELRHPEPGLYIAGIKSYGRAPTFLLRTGYRQVASIAAALAGVADRADDARPSCAAG